LVALGAAAALLALFLYWGSEPPFAEKQCQSARNTDDGLGAPQGTESASVVPRYTLFPLHLVCDWERADGTGTETTSVDVGGWTPAISLISLAGGIVLILRGNTRQPSSR